MRETLVTASSPRLLTALAPVMVQHADGLPLQALHRQLSAIGLEARLGWLAESTLDALAHGRVAGTGAHASRARRVKAVLSSYLTVARRLRRASQAQFEDVLDGSIRSEATVNAVRQQRCAIAERWGVVTRLGRDDFVRALRAAREAA